MAIPHFNKTLFRLRYSKTRKDKDFYESLYQCLTYCACLTFEEADPDIIRTEMGRQVRQDVTWCVTGYVVCYRSRGVLQVTWCVRGAPQRSRHVAWENLWFHMRDRVRQIGIYVICDVMLWSMDSNVIGHFFESVSIFKLKEREEMEPVPKWKLNTGELWCEHCVNLVIWRVLVCHLCARSTETVRLYSSAQCSSVQQYFEGRRHWN